MKHAITAAILIAIAWIPPVAESQCPQNEQRVLLNSLVPIFGDEYMKHVHKQIERVNDLNDDVVRQHGLYRVNHASRSRFLRGLPSRRKARLCETLAGTEYTMRDLHQHFRTVIKTAEQLLECADFWPEGREDLIGIKSLVEQARSWHGERAKGLFSIRQRNAQIWKDPGAMASITNPNSFDENAYEGLESGLTPEPAQERAEDHRNRFMKGEPDEESCADNAFDSDLMQAVLVPGWVKPKRWRVDLDYEIFDPEVQPAEE